MVNNEGENGVGAAGLVFSMVGWLTCGLLCSLGFLLGFIASFGGGKKGHTIAALIVGYPGGLFLAFSGVAVKPPN